MFIEEDDYLAHYGILRKSGRYPWGSGPNVPARSRDFKGWVKEMRAQGLSDATIAKGVGLTLNQLRAVDSISTTEITRADINQAIKLREKGMAYKAIGEKLGRSEGNIKDLLSDSRKEKSEILQKTAEALKSEVDKHGFIDVGTGVENFLNVSRTKLDTALAILEIDGYQIHPVNLPQPTTGLMTKFKVLVKPGVTKQEAFANRDNIRVPNVTSKDNGRSFLGMQPPLQLDPKRVKVAWAEDGGADFDGVIFVRPGIKDLSLGKNQYAQVRIAVGKDHYMKGMAIYKDDLPDGTEILFNTNKSRKENVLDALKEISRDDPNNPFGAEIKAGGQIIERDKNGKNVVTSHMNILKDAGDVAKFRDRLASQLLGKQSIPLAQTQLRKLREREEAKFEEIMSLTNPAVKKKLLSDFAESADKHAVDLDAAALPRQKNHFILPLRSIKETQVYAPGFDNGESVALVRFPHAGRFEIPILTVNNKNQEGIKLLGRNPIDAVGINPKVAEILSGADFDGDTVLVIPNNDKKIKNETPLVGLKDFDPRTLYKGYEGMKKMTKQQHGLEMGKASNLITDMTISKAPADQMARAVRHSMVVVDAEKHGLDWKRSEKEHGIAQLKKEYQPEGGVSTLLSRAKSPDYSPETRPSRQSEGGRVNPKTGEKQETPTGRLRRDSKTGELVPAMQERPLLSTVKDARTLSSGSKIEEVYAEHSNRMKDLANKARLAELNTPPLKYSPSAKKVYKDEVESLDRKLAAVVQNRPLERQAVVIANANIRAKRQSNPNLDKKQVKRLKSLSLQEARNRIGASGKKVDITDIEWEAIQAGAISNNKLVQILDKADSKRVLELATPKRKLLMNTASTARAKALLANGATRAEVAKALGVSLTTLDEGIK